MADLISYQLDRSKPLWELVVIDGLSDRQFAVAWKIHHSMVDGVSGTELLTVIMDLTPEPSPGVADTWQAEPAPSRTDLVVGAVRDLARSPYEQLRAIRASTRVPRQAIRQLTSVGRGVAAMGGVIRPTPRSTLNGPIGPHRRHTSSRRGCQRHRATHSGW